jgi:hypothetical protein
MKNNDLLNVSENTITSIMHILIDLHHTDVNDMDVIRFSDVNRKKNNRIEENVDRFKKFDINNLPLIGVAKYLN